MSGERMQAMKAQVRNGRLVLDEPTDLPEGEVVELVRLGDVLAGSDGLDDDERSALHREIQASIEDADSGETEDFAKVLAELRQRK